MKSKMIKKELAKMEAKRDNSINVAVKHEISIRLSEAQIWQYRHVY